MRQHSTWAGSLEIRLEDEGAEYDEVEYEVDRDQRKHAYPVGLRVSGKNAVQDQVDQTI